MVLILNTVFRLLITFVTFASQSVGLARSDEHGAELPSDPLSQKSNYQMVRRALCNQNYRYTT